MATITNKNISTLVGKYVKNYREFDNYMKHCLNILKNYNWLKENLFNSEIQDSQYFEKMVNNIGLSHFSLAYFCEKYYEDVVKKIPSNTMKNVKTNIYYLDEGSKIASVFNNLSSINKKIGISSSNNEIQINENYSRSFCRMMYSIVTHNYDLDLEKEYTFDEIYNLVLDGKIVVFNSYTVQSDISENELIRDIRDRKKIFANSSVSTIIDYTSVIASSFYDMIGKEQRSMWYVINMPFCHYIRYGSVGDSINYNEEFYITINHIIEIINGVERYYKRRRKGIPKSYKELIDYMLINIEKEKNNFEKELAYIFNDHDENVFDDNLKLIKKINYKH